MTHVSDRAIDAARLDTDRLDPDVERPILGSAASPEVADCAERTA